MEEEKMVWERSGEVNSDQVLTVVRLNHCLCLVCGAQVSSKIFLML